MYINIIDYRGSKTTQTLSRGDTLFDYRTKYFVKQQQDFPKWQQHGHKFICFTQHPDDKNFDGFDKVVPIPRGTCDESRNAVFDYHKQQSSNWKWMGLWDNDSTLYWTKNNSSLLPEKLDEVCAQAQQQGIAGWVPFNPQQAPYVEVDLNTWTFKPTIHLKGSMMFLHNEQQWYDTSFAYHGGDLRYAIELTRKGKKCAWLDQAALNELVTGKSTVFQINAYHEKYKKPGPDANPKGLKKWDSTIARRERLKVHFDHILTTTGLTVKDWQKKQRDLWQQDKTIYSKLFLSP